MSIHAQADWDGLSVPTQTHVAAVVQAMQQNHEILVTRWTPHAFAILSRADAVLFCASLLMDVCGRKPRLSEIRAVTEEMLDDERPVAVGFLKRIFKQLEVPSEQRHG